MSHVCFARKVSQKRQSARADALDEFCAFAVPVLTAHGHRTGAMKAIEKLESEQGTPESFILEKRVIPCLCEMAWDVETGEGEKEAGHEDWDKLRTFLIKRGVIAGKIDEALYKLFLGRGIIPAGGRLGVITSHLRANDGKLGAMNEAELLKQGMDPETHSHKRKEAESSKEGSKKRRRPPFSETFGEPTKRSRWEESGDEAGPVKVNSRGHIVRSGEAQYEPETRRADDLGLGDLSELANVSDSDSDSEDGNESDDSIVVNDSDIEEEEESE